MAVTRRRFLETATAAVAAPAIMRRAVAAEPGAPLPVPPAIEVDASGGAMLEAIAGTRAILAGAQTAVVGFNQPFLGPVLRVKRGRTARVDVRNRLREPITVHWHGLHVPGRVDGGPHTPIAPAARWSPALEITQPAATLWYHSHVHGRTAEHVYWGLAGMLLVDDPQAPADELPSQYGIDDLPLVIQDRAFAADGALAYTKSGPVLMAGFRADHILVNGALRPRAEVPPGVVRLRLLNGSNARIYRLFLDEGRPMHQVGSDGGLLPARITRRELVLAPGERVDVLVDFAGAREVRLLSRPDGNSPMRGMMGGRGMGMGPGSMPSGQPPAVAEDGAFEVMRFAIDPARAAVQRALPTRLAGAPPGPSDGEVTRRRRFELDTHGAMMGGGMMGRGGMGGMAMTINGRPFAMDRIDARARLGQAEVWEVHAADMAHPFHVHGTSFSVLGRNGAPVAFATNGWKDTVLVEGSVELLVRFAHAADEAAPYMLHCHILEHEDAGMMGQFTVS